MADNTASPRDPKMTEETPLINITASGCEALKLYEREIATYLRELPRLLAEGHAGRSSCAS
jgi:hypothetical protein